MHAKTLCTEDVRKPSSFCYLPKFAATRERRIGSLNISSGAVRWLPMEHIKNNPERLVDPVSGEAG
jgi:hypothetical protein